MLGIFGFKLLYITSFLIIKVRMCSWKKSNELKFGNNRVFTIRDCNFQFAKTSMFEFLNLKERCYCRTLFCQNCTKFWFFLFIYTTTLKLFVCTKTINKNNKCNKHLKETWKKEILIFLFLFFYIKMFNIFCCIFLVHVCFLRNKKNVNKCDHYVNNEMLHLFTFHCLHKQSRKL